MPKKLKLTAWAIVDKKTNKILRYDAAFQDLLNLHLTKTKALKSLYCRCLIGRDKGVKIIKVQIKQL